MDISQANCPSCSKPMQIKQMRCPDCEVNLEGEFEVPALAKLPLEDQLFVTAFLRQHGSIKQMERLFGISYPTVKNRLNAIAGQLDRSFEAQSPNSRVLALLDRGEITVSEALERLQ